MSFLLKNDVEVLKESEPMLSTIVKRMFSTTFKLQLRPEYDNCF